MHFGGAPWQKQQIFAKAHFFCMYRCKKDGKNLPVSLKISNFAAAKCYNGAIFN